MSAESTLEFAGGRKSVLLRYFETMPKVFEGERYFDGAFEVKADPDQPGVLSITISAEVSAGEISLCRTDIIDPGSPLRQALEAKFRAVQLNGEMLELAPKELVANAVLEETAGKFWGRITGALARFGKGRDIEEQPVHA